MANCRTMATTCLLFIMLTLMATVRMATAGDYTEIMPTRTVFPNPQVQVSATWATTPARMTRVSAAQAGAIFVAEQGGLFLMEPEAGGLSFHEIAGIPDELDGNSFVMMHDGHVVGFLSASHIFVATCDLQTKFSCAVDAQVAVNMGKVYDGAVSGKGNVFWVAAEKGFFMFERESNAEGAAGAAGAARIILPGPMFATTVAGDADIFCGNGEKIWRLNGSGSIVRWEWVTDVATASGGVIDDTITSIYSDASSATVYIGNPTCLNTYANESYHRIGWDEGLPYGNITSITMTSRAQLVLGTTKGLVIYEKENDPQWRYLYGPRWIVGNNVKSVASLSNSMIVVLTESGVTWLDQELWSLAKKATHYESIALERHNRHGMIAECKMAAFGDTRNCTQGDSDNNGLWTSLMVVAEYMRYAVTGSKQALVSASTWFEGMVLLNNVTGKPGLMARSCCSPEEFKAKTCGVGSWIHDKEHWHNSTNPAYPGWIWKGDTSSDETTGHVFALSVVARLSPLASERHVAEELLVNFVSGLVENDYLLIDVTGNATTWGRWSPKYVNGFRGFSDERGLQSLQMLSYLAAAANVSGSSGGKWAQAYAELTNATNQYNENMIDLKIKSPCDINYSDDELTFLPYFTYLFMCPAQSSSCGFDSTFVMASLENTFAFVEQERSSLWSVIYEALTGTRDASLLDDILWNLRTWQLDMIEWPSDNQYRQDILYEQGTTRFGRVHTQSTKSKSPLPANERNQGRWNSNPYDISPGGSGMSEQDPGAWLLPYWMGRYYGIISATD